MTTGYVYMIAFIGTHFLVILTMYLICKYKGILMEQMMITMALSMVFGLAIGVFTGVVHHGNLLLSTLLSMGIAGIVGGSLGLRLHPLAGVEGFFTAVMAGMMGAMIVEMLTVQEGNILLLISLFLLTGTTMFCVRHMLYQAFEHVIRKYDLLLLIATCCLFLITLWTFPDVQQQYPPPEEFKPHV